MKTRISTIMMVAVLFISTAVSAQKPMGPSDKNNKKEMMKPGMKHDSQKADFLTEDQKEAMKKLHLETTKELKPLKNELHEIMAHQQTLTTADNADLKAINKNIDKMAGIKAEMAKIMAKQHQAFRSQLTEEQLIKFDIRKNKMHHGKKNKYQRKRAEVVEESIHHGRV